MNGEEVRLCQLGYEDPYPDLTLKRLKKLVSTAINDFVGIDREDIFLKVFGSPVVPESIGIAFYVSASTILREDYFQSTTFG
jgi:hypothetical protein